MNDIRLGIMSRYLEDQAWKFFKEIPDTIILQRSTMENILDPVNRTSDEDGRSALHFTNFHSMDEHPEEVNGEGYTDDVLIDIDGKRETFRVGWYDPERDQWYLHDKKEHVELDVALWCHLPLIKNDKGWNKES